MPPLNGERFSCTGDNEKRCHHDCLLRQQPRRPDIRRRFFAMTPPAISPTGGWIGTTIFVIMFLAALILFGLRVGELVTLLAKARREQRTDRIEERIGDFFLMVLGQK